MNGAKIIGGGGAGAGLGAAVVYVSGRFGAHLQAEDGALIATGTIAVGAFLVHNGIKGAIDLIWRGGSKDKPAAEPAPAA